MSSINRAVFKVTSQSITRFARVVGDSNQVHTDADYAAKTRFKYPISHGMVAMVMLNQLIPQGKAIKEYDVKFMKPIYPQSEVEAALEIKEESDFELKLQIGDKLITEVKGRLLELS